MEKISAICVFAVLVAVNATNTSEEGLFWAAHDGDLSYVTRALAEGTSPQWNDEGYTAIHAAAISNYPFIVSALLDAGVDIDLKTNGEWADGSTPLVKASSYGNLAVVTLLITRGADVDIPDNNGFTPLMAVALRSRSFLTAEALINAGANVTLSFKSGSTALHLAAYSDKPYIARLLLQHGADPMAQAINGYTPGDLARQQLFNELADFIDNFPNTSSTPPALKCQPTMVHNTTQNNEEMLYWAALGGDSVTVTHLLAQRISPIWCDTSKGVTETAIHAASRMNHPNIVSALLDAGVDIDLQDYGYGATPLIKASSDGSLDVVKLLIARGADVDKPNKHGFTPLIALALRSGSLPIAEALINAGADINLKDNHGETALQVATENYPQLGQFIDHVSRKSYKGASDHGIMIMTVLIGVINTTEMLLLLALG